MDNKNTDLIKLKESLLKHQRSKQEEDLKNQLIQPVLFYEKGSDEFLDRLFFKVKLIGGNEFSFEDFILEKPFEYRSHFYKEFYLVTADLFGIDRKLMDNYRKPQCAADATNSFIYSRFPNRVVSHIRSKCKWLPDCFEREFKLFQFLSPIMVERLDLYIDQYVELAKKYPNNLTGFKEAFCESYKIPQQIEMW